MPEYIKTYEVDHDRFYKMPKSLFNNKRYEDLTLEAKVIYTVLRDRCCLSQANKWEDQDHNTYLLYSIKKLASIIECSESTISRALNQLSKHELIVTKRQGLGLPNKIFVCRAIKTLDDIKNCQSDSSEDVNSTTLDKSDLHTNDTEVSETNLNEKGKVKPSISTSSINGVQLSKPELNEYTKKVIRYFFDGYKDLTGKLHPKINMDTAQRIESLLHKETVWDECHGRDIPFNAANIEEMIDTYFETEYPLESGGYADHRIYHFLSDGVLMVLAYRFA